MLNTFGQSYLKGVKIGIKIIRQDAVEGAHNQGGIR